ncbi:hypothetical protein [Chryseobacterium sp.]|nr:hypothetical protein [Chryseobacterium sp.]
MMRRSFDFAQDDIANTNHYNYYGKFHGVILSAKQSKDLYKL